MSETNHISMHNITVLRESSVSEHDKAYIYREYAATLTQKISWK